MTHRRPSAIALILPMVWASSGGSAAQSTRAAAAIASTDKAVAQFENRIAERPDDYLSATILGQLYARRARETGDLDSYRRAEDAFREALRSNQEHQPARLGLAATLASQHRFADALQIAGTVSKANPGSVEALTVLGDASVEIGNYKEAEVAFEEVAIRIPDQPSVLARLAHIAELKGKHGQALQLLERAAERELAEEGEGETAAWYRTRIGALLFRTGKLDDAAKSYESALRLFDGYYIALDGLADVRGAQGRLDEAIRLLELAVTGSGAVAQPGSLMALGDLYLKKGRAADARRLFQRAQSIAERPSHQSAYRRELAMFYADHNESVAKALDLARQDLDARPDVYGYDALAWTLYKNSRFEEASAAMVKALTLGTQDATMLAHAGLIEYRRGRPSEALAYLRSASDLCSYLLTDEARLALSDLSGRRPAR